ncbi:MAG: helix-turn-helix domain-containing protein [Nocardioidaceae bacterium]|nr:helix-turn-helix domain-containing protein [Nocardioidaceae bacterium]
MTLEKITPPPQALRALSHPGRLRMLGLLRGDGPTTASRLAERLGLNSGATSYHLRQLAVHGFVEEDTTRGNGRERWWRSVHKSTTTNEATTDPEVRDAVDAFAQSMAVVHTEQLQRAMEERPLLDAAWRRTATVSDWVLRLTADDGAELMGRLVALFEEFAGREPAEGESTEGTAELVFQLHSFPRPGTVAGLDGEGLAEHSR